MCADIGIQIISESQSLIHHLSIITNYITGYILKYDSLLLY